MPPDLRDASYVWDILEEARHVLEFTAGLTFEEYRSRRVVNAAVERCIEIIGEAARRLSDEFKAAHAAIPWAKIVAQRNVLAHEYRDVRHEKIWQVVIEELPPLVDALKTALPPLPPDQEAGR